MPFLAKDFSHSPEGIILGSQGMNFLLLLRVADGIYGVADLGGKALRDSLVRQIAGTAGHLTHNEIQQFWRL